MGRHIIVERRFSLTEKKQPPINGRSSGVDEVPDVSALVKPVCVGAVGVARGWGERGAVCVAPQRRAYVRAETPRLKRSAAQC